MPVGWAVVYLRSGKCQSSLQVKQALAVSSKEISVLSQEVQDPSDSFVRHQSYNSYLELMGLVGNLAYQLDHPTSVSILVQGTDRDFSY